MRFFSAGQQIGDTKLLLMRKEEEEEGVSMQFLSFPQPPQKQEQCTLEWAILVCHNIAMAPQQAKKISIFFFFLNALKRGSKQEKNLNVNHFFPHLTQCTSHASLGVCIVPHIL